MLTIETLVLKTLYTKNTIYTHSVGLGIKPIRGLFKTNQGKGTYTEEDLQKLLQYKRAVQGGKTKEEAYREVRKTYG